MRANFIFLTFCLFLLLLEKQGYSQKVLDPEFRPPDVRWDNFPVNGGEASQESISILIDSRGFLWTGTETGLYRFDGTRFKEYRVRRGSYGGFTGMTVTCIFEDSDGTIWIGTSEALNRLDQKDDTFRSFFPDSCQKAGIGNFIRTIRESRGGQLWILTRKNICLFERETGKFTAFKTDSLSWYPKNSVSFDENDCFTEDSLGNKWFVTYNGLYRYDENHKRFSNAMTDTVNSLNYGKVTCVKTVSDGKILIGTMGGGILKWNYETEKPEQFISRSGKPGHEGFENITAILEDRNGSVWSFGNGVFSNFDPVTNKIKDYVFLYKHRTIYESPGSEVWIDQAFQSGDGAIWFLNKMAGLMFWFDPSAEKLSLYRTPAFIVHQCIMDKTGSFWFACVRNNIFRLVTSQLPYYVIQVGNISDVAQTHKGNIVEDGRDKLWFILNLGIFYSGNFDVTTSIEFEKLKLPYTDDTFGSGLKDSNGDLWFGSKSGRIVRYKTRLNKFEDFTPYKKQDKTELCLLPLIREDKAGIIWIATTHHGLFRFDRQKNKLEHIFDFMDESGDWDQKILLDFLIDSNGGFWLLTGEKLLYLRMPEMKITDYTNQPDNIFTPINSCIRAGEDSKGNVYILNNISGVYRYNRQDESFKKADIIDEGPGTFYYDLLVDRLDRLWVAHQDGITIFNSDINTSRSIKIPNLQFDIQSFQAGSGDIIFLNDSWLYVFRENPPVNNFIPPVSITRIFVNGKDKGTALAEINEEGSQRTLTLSYKNNSLDFEFAALNYLDPERNQFRYYMKGFDKDTVLVGQNISAEYKNMPPGRYRFWVTGSNNDGVFNKTGTFVNVRIYPPWYRSFAAYLAYAVFGVFILFFYIRKRLNNLERDKKRLESEVKARTSELELKNRQLAEMDRLKTRFFTDISHEIRTPLSLIIGPLENFPEEEIVGPRISGIIDLVKRNAFRLSHLVNQLLDISKLDAGKMKILLGEDDIVKCLRMLVYEFLSFAEAKKIKYIVDLPEQPFITWFDRDKIEKIVSNLLSNAFKYTPQAGSVQCIITIKPGEDRRDEPELHIRVVDTGPGISSEHKEMIFDRFYRIESRNEAEGHGTGIGLSLVREFINLLHGKIEIVSSPGKGSEFSVIIPLGKNHFADEEFILQERTENKIVNNLAGDYSLRFPFYFPGQPETGKMSVLLIEDHKELRDFIREELNQKYTVLEADNGKTGMNMTFTMMPDLIVTDIMMPDMDGLELCSKLKNDERTSHIPIILLTARATYDDRMKGLMSGADDYIIKPFSISELSIRISNLLSLRDKIKLKYGKFQLLESGSEKSLSVDDKFMGRIIRIITGNINNYMFDVVTLGEQAGMSKSHLTRKIKILTGFSPGTLIRNIRLEKAAELLLKRNGNITEVANSVGYANPSNFTKAFRNYFGVSPKDYRLFNNDENGSGN